MAGYPFRTPGDLGGLIDRMDEMERLLRQVTSPTSEQYNQVVSKLQGTVDDLADTVTALGKTTTELGKQTTRLDDTVAALPAIASAYNSNTGQALTSSFVDKAILTLVVPQGKTKLNAQIVANAAFVDRTTGGLTSAELRITITIGGTTLVSPIFPSSKDAGASAVNNILSGSYFVDQSGLAPGNYLARVQVRGLNNTAFPASSGNLCAASAIYTAGN